MNDQVELTWALSRIYKVVKQGNTTTVLVEATAGDPLYLSFSTTEKARIKSGEMKAAGKKVILEAVFNPSSSPAQYHFQTGNQLVRILVMDQAALAKTWFPDYRGKEAIVTGVSYLAETTFSDGRFDAIASYPIRNLKDTQPLLYLEDGVKTLKIIAKDSPPADTVLNLTTWKNKDASVFATAAISNKDWFSSTQPLQMGADGNLTNSAWYRTQFNAPGTGKYTLQTDGGGRATVFVDGNVVRTGLSGLAN